MKMTEEKYNEGVKNRERYLEAKEKYDRLNEHIKEMKNNGLKHDGPTLTLVTRTQGKRYEAFEEVLLCLASQTCHDFEFIIIPHNAEEDKVKTITDMVNELPKWLRDQTKICPLNEGNRSRPLNYGMKIAKGLYVAFLDDDDLVMEDYIESFVESIKKEYGKVMHGYVVPQDWSSNDDGKNHALLRAEAEPLDIYCRPFSIENEMTLNFCPFMGQAFPVYAFRELGIEFDESLDTTEDWDYLMKTAAICGVYNIKKVIAVYRIWKNSETSHTEHSKKIWDDNYKKLVQRYKELEIVYPFKDDEDPRFPIYVEGFYSDKKGVFSVKKQIKMPFTHDKSGRTVIKLEDLKSLGRIISFRFDPDTLGNRVVNNYKISITLEDGSVYPIENAYRYTNGVEHADNSFNFPDEDPQICYNFDKPIVIKSIEITYFIDEFIKDKKYKPKKVRRSFIKRCKNKIKKILRWIKARL